MSIANINEMGKVSLQFNKCFVLFAQCIIVRGYARSLLCDLQRQSYRLIPNDLEEILFYQHSLTLGEIFKDHDDANRTILAEYFEFLLENEFGFMCDPEQVENFPALEMTFDAPAEITNFILDIDGSSKHDYAGIFNQLSAIRCHYIQIRILERISFEEIKLILQETKNKNFRSVEIIKPYEEGDAENMSQIYFQYPITRIDIYDTPENKIEGLRKSTEGAKSIFFFGIKSITEKSCGVVSSRQFNLTVEHFTESKHFNSCLNKKLSIDRNGYIKSCPSMVKSLGHTSEINILQAIKLDSISEFWGISKDKIEICKDCEFRYVCTDCRAYLKDPQDVFSKPLKCGYDPYTTEWKNWETDATNLKAIEYYSVK